MELLSLRKYAEHRGVSLAAVQKAIASGRIQVAREVPQGSKTLKFIDPALADRMWNELTNPEQQRVATRAEMGRVPENKPVDSIPLSLFGETKEETSEENDSAVKSKNSTGVYGERYNKARSIKEEYNAKIAEIELRERMGELVDKNELARELFNLSAGIQQNLLNAPVQIAPIIHSRCMAFVEELKDNTAATLEVREIEDIISGEIKQILEGLANGIDITRF